MTEYEATPSETPQEVKNSKAAIWSLVLAIAAPITCFIAIIPAIICGICGLVNISKSDGKLKGKGLAISGLVLAPAWFVIMGAASMMLAILMPALAQTRHLAQRMVSGTNLTGLGVAVMVYTNENDNQYPTPDTWCDLLIEEADVSPNQFINPASQLEEKSSYAINDAIYRCQEDCPDNMVLMFESVEGWNLHGGMELLSTEYPTTDGANILFVDGHVEFVKTEDIPYLNWGTEQK